MNKISNVLLGLGVVIALVAVVRCNLPSKEPTYENLSNSAVKVVNVNQNSGGSGVILSSGLFKSIILTNKHVCKVIENGGYVVRRNESYKIQAYKKYDRHDLCLVEVMANLGVNNTVTKTKPDYFSTSLVIGHPGLMPAVLSKGHFSSEENITMATGIKSCENLSETEIDALRPDEIMQCLFFGGMVIYERFESQLVTSTIMPGSSGSAVFNDNFEISGLVFAGRGGELTYGYIVPYQYILEFLDVQDELAWVVPGQVNRSALLVDIFNFNKCKNKSCSKSFSNMLWLE